MKEVITIITLQICFVLSIPAQTFEKLYSQPENETIIEGLIEYEKEFIFGSSFERNGAYHTQLLRVDSMGIVKDSLLIPLPSSVNFNPIRLMSLLNGNIYLFNNEGSNGNVSELYGFKLDLNSFTIIDSHKIDITYPSSFVQLEYIKNCNCFTLVGGSEDSNNVKRATVLQLDTSFNVVREKHFASQFVQADPFFLDVEEFKDSSLLIYANEPLDTLKGIGPATLIQLDRKLVRDSVNFTFLWSDSLSKVPGWGNFWLGSGHFSALTDTSFIAFGEVLTDHFDRNLNQYVPEQNVGYAVFDTAYRFLRWEFYGMDDTTDIRSLEGVSKNNSSAYLFHTGNFEFFFGSTSIFTLRKVDLQGNEIFTKFYSFPFNHTAVSVLATSDGGALMIGTNLNQNHNPNVAERDVYVLKVDSMGNLAQPVGLEEESSEISKNNFLVYPNPMNEELNLVKVNHFKPYEFKMYDVNGKKVKQLRWENVRERISTHNLPSGVYFYQLVDENGRSAEGKLIKQ